MPELPRLQCDNTEPHNYSCIILLMYLCRVTRAMLTIYVIKKINYLLLCHWCIFSPLSSQEAEANCSCTETCHCHLCLKDSKAQRAAAVKSRATFAAQFIQWFSNMAGIRKTLVCLTFKKSKVAVGLSSLESQIT